MLAGMGMHNWRNIIHYKFWNIIHYKFFRRLTEADLSIMLSRVFSTTRGSLWVRENTSSSSSSKSSPVTHAQRLAAAAGHVWEHDRWIGHGHNMGHKCSSGQPVRYIIVISNQHGIASHDYATAWSNTNMACKHEKHALSWTLVVYFPWRNG